MKVGDLVKVEGGKLRPDWYGLTGVVTSLSVPDIYKVIHQKWYEVSLLKHGTKIIRADMLKVLSESR